MQEFFTTEQVAELVGLDVKKDKWRVVKFAQSKEYGIKPSVGAASGSGSRRLYDLQNVCEIALALRLLEAGLRSKVIGKVIRQVRGRKLSTMLEAISNDETEFYLGILRSPFPGQPLDKSRDQEVICYTGGQLAEAMTTDYLEKHPDQDLILVRLRKTFFDLNRRLSLLRAKQRSREEE